MKKIAASPPPARVRTPPAAILPDRETREALRKQRRSRSGKRTPLAITKKARADIARYLEGELK